MHYIKDEVWEAMELYQHYEKGFLPAKGAIYDQTIVYIEAINIIRRIYNRIKIDDLEKDRKTHEKGVR